MKENINFELYKVFYYVAKYKNITYAANELFISQPAITQSIKKLEDQIGYILFYRTKHGMKLTKDGEILFDYLKSSIECLQNGKKKIEQSSQEKNIIRIGGGTTTLEYHLLKPLKKFRKQFSVQFMIEHNMTTNLLKMIQNDELDLAIVTGNVKPLDDIIWIPIGEIQNRFIANTEAFKQYQGKIFSVKELNQLPLILQGENSSTKKFLDQITNHQKINLQGTYQLISYRLVLEFVKAGFGIGFIDTHHVKKELESKKLFELKVDLEIPKRYIYAVIHKKNDHDHLLQQFIQYLKNES